MVRLTENVIQIHKQNFKWFMSEKYMPKKAEYTKTKLKCDCGCEFTKLHNSKLRVPYRHATRYVDFTNKFSDICFECGRELEYIDHRELNIQKAKSRDITLNQRDLILDYVRIYNEMLMKVIN